ncbi:hypothetical protein TBLA_0A00660 [Henningerozyma blattae CBS 6284]|uniref:Glutathione peroxidase n=1 Tax=Henningerozyma blattae (strain ATCC 34711 / CBS 6284 / DSM 70876 / NBRC 10599 / NRRL Y-10934 / UCD 77-7) TaxID=1071380 RepID=I2GUR6_HENB6|nr:hypothetical protein TBLA_0A00660 [Tetrapisispora blattae CBS 6284]CCH57868.1 hypothetical protein TBLA_0A00660 [Tetrapisispora blattae CBS 6284]
MSEFYKLIAVDTDKKPYPFSQLKGKVVLIVNVYLHFGYMPQYKELEILYEKYKDRGFVILAFPCAQFEHEARDSPDEIQEDIKQLEFVTKFPIMNEVNVNGPDTNPVYKYLKSKVTDSLGLRNIKWNFAKFLIDRDGNVVNRYSSLVKPSSLENIIERLLDKNETWHVV